MSSRILKALIIMFVTGVLLVPTAVPHAVQDLQDLKTIIDSASMTINAAPNNSSWGFLYPAAPAGQLSTADLVSNITTTVLRAKYQLDINKVAWITTPNTTNGTNSTTDPTPFPSTTAPSNVSLDEPYVDYVSSIPNFSVALTALGRSWHKEMNKPVWDAIDNLQQTMSTFSTSMLSEDLIHSPSLIRTIRASSSLEDAQQAWSRILNLPGSTKASKRGVGVEGKRTLDGTRKKFPVGGGYYTHKDLWGRATETRVRQSEEGSARMYAGVVQCEEKGTERTRPHVV